jgi:hypothetical protein
MAVQYGGREVGQGFAPEALTFKETACYGGIIRVSLDIPDEFAAALTTPGEDPARAALEAWGLEAYRQRRLSGYQLRMLLGLPSRWDLHASEGARD